MLLAYRTACGERELGVERLESIDEPEILRKSEYVGGRSRGSQWRGSLDAWRRQGGQLSPSACSSWRISSITKSALVAGSACIVVLARVAAVRIVSCSPFAP